MRIAIAGSRGMVGSSIVRNLQSEFDVIQLSREELDLTDRGATIGYISKLRPDVIIDAAAKVGGIGANNQNPVEFLQINLQIQKQLNGGCAFRRRWAINILRIIVHLSQEYTETYY